MEVDDQVDCLFGVWSVVRNKQVTRLERDILRFSLKDACSKQETDPSDKGQADETIESHCQETNARSSDKELKRAIHSFGWMVAILRCLVISFSFNEVSIGRDSEISASVCLLGSRTHGWALTTHLKVGRIRFKDCWRF